MAQRGGVLAIGDFGQMGPDELQVRARTRHGRFRYRRLGSATRAPAALSPRRARPAPRSPRAALSPRRAPPAPRSARARTAGLDAVRGAVRRSEYFG